jgi:tetratricopeptide (TPR) repeat protein
MKKQKRPKPGSRSQSVQKTKGSNGNGQIVSLASRRPHRIGELGILARDYPPAAERRRAIEAVRAKPEDRRTSDDWWALGEYLVLDGLLDEDDALLNQGIEALSRGVVSDPPSPACMLDLGWVLMSKGLDALALPHLVRATELAVRSRDAWILRGWVHAGLGQRDAAITAFKAACALPAATEGDRQTLRELEKGTDPRGMRANVLLRKLEPENVRLAHGRDPEAPKAFLHMARMLLERSPDDPTLLYLTAYTRYVLGQYGRAKPLLERLLAIKPDHADGMVILALMAKKNGDNARASELYQQALAADPANMLALTNLASLLQDLGEYHAARPLLKRALAQDAKGNEYYGIALDLYGSNVGVIDQDFLHEADLHRQAIQKDPGRATFRANLIVALLSAGEIKRARQEWQASKHLLSNLPNFKLLDSLMKAYSADLPMPESDLDLARLIEGQMGIKAILPLVQKAWRWRRSAEAENAMAVREQVGILAGRAGKGELALEAWRELKTMPGGELFELNEAVELSHLGRHSEALKVIDRAPKLGNRAWTVTGNIRMQAGMRAAAVEAYRMALDHDEDFLLPLQSAVACASELGQPGLLEPFVGRLREARWAEDAGARLVLGEALLLQGKPSTATDTLLSVLSRDGAIRTPEDIHADLQDLEDPTLLGVPHARFHYVLARACLRARRFGELALLIQAVTSWARWTNGDWNVAHAEMLRLAGMPREADATIESMAPQPPPMLTQALSALALGEVERTAQLASLIAADQQAEGYSHPEGRPDALARALLSLVALKRLDLKEAEEQGREAVRRDPSCPLARDAWAQALAQLGQFQEALEVLDDGLRRRPGEPRLVEAAVRVALEGAEVQRADRLLQAHRELLGEHDAAATASLLGELIALARLEVAGVQQAQPIEAVWPWVEQLDRQERHWMGAARLCAEKPETRAGCVLYFAKVAEKTLFERVMRPFLETVEARVTNDPRYEDIARHVAGGRPPALGGMVRLLGTAAGPFRSAESPLVTAFRRYLRSAPSPLNGELLLEGSLAASLGRLARARNDAAHLEDPTEAEQATAFGLMVDGEGPGLFVRALGIEGR